PAGRRRPPRAARAPGGWYTSARRPPGRAGGSRPRDRSPADPAPVSRARPVPTHRAAAPRVRSRPARRRRDRPPRAAGRRCPRGRDGRRRHAGRDAGRPTAPPARPPGGRSAAAATPHRRTRLPRAPPRALPSEVPYATDSGRATRQSAQPSALGILRPLARLVATVLLALDLARVARDVAGLLQRRAEVGIGPQQRACDPVADRHRLGSDTAAAHVDLDAELSRARRHLERLLHDHARGLA